MIAGIPYRDVHALEFTPGEIRLDITPESVRALYETKKEDPNYLTALEDGPEMGQAIWGPIGAAYQSELPGVHWRPSKDGSEEGEDPITRRVEAAREALAKEKDFTTLIQPVSKGAFVTVS